MPVRQTLVLTANSVATFTLSGPRRLAFSGVRIKTDGAAALSYVVGTSSALADPAFRADDTYFLPAAPSIDYPEMWQSRFETVVVKVISPGTPTVAVEAF